LGKQKLTVRFHNPNSAKSTSEHIGKVFVAANMKKLEQSLKKVPARKNTKHETASPPPLGSGDVLCA